MVEMMPWPLWFQSNIVEVGRKFRYSRGSKQQRVETTGTGWKRAVAEREWVREGKLVGVEQRVKRVERHKYSP